MESNGEISKIPEKKRYKKRKIRYKKRKVKNDDFSDLDGEQKEEASASFLEELKKNPMSKDYRKRIARNL